MEEIFIQFDFKTNNGKKKPIQFVNPDKIFTTDNVAEVKPILEALEAEHKSGKYIAGYLSYEAAEAFNPRYKMTKEPTMPLLWFATFDHPVKQQVSLANESYDISDWQSTETQADYHKRIATIQEAIAQGITKQVNYTTRLTSQFSGEPYAFYQQLLKNQQADYSAYLDIGSQQILSASPELFFKINQDKITTRPMKGTITRGRTLEEDEANINYLRHSDKEREENLMIVELMKDDLSKLAVPGTVSVPEQLTIETYPTLHQMTSTVTAKLKEDSQIIDWFTALFPCGSITGTPRLETIQLIDQLETAPRDVYCGAIGYITPEREAVFNVPIRTVVVDQENNQARFGVGGGITAGSKANEEYKETQTKADFLTQEIHDFSLLESILLSEGQYPYLSYHLKRLSRSASYFSYPYQEAELTEKLNNLAGEFLTNDYKVRLLVDSGGEVQLSVEQIDPGIKHGKVYLAERPIRSDDPFLYHKTTIRDQYEDLAVGKPDNFSTLLWNERGELTEFTIGNLVLKIDGEFVTPPISAGLLAGTFRQYLLDRGKISERRLHKSDLLKAEEVWFINAVRGWVKVEVIM